LSKSLSKIKVSFPWPSFQLPGFKEKRAECVSGRAYEKQHQVASSSLSLETT